MSIWIATLVAALSISTSVGPAPNPADEPTGSGLTKVRTAVSDDRQGIDAAGEWARQHEPGDRAAATPSDAPVLDEYTNAPACIATELKETTPLNAPCRNGQATEDPAACDGQPPVEPRWVRHRATEASPWDSWEWVAPGGCPADVVPVFTVEDFRRLPLAPPTLHLQPDRGWVLVNLDTIVSTDKTEQTFRTELLGHGIDVVATPDTFTYDWGDGTRPLTTHSAGHPYPHQDTFHAYTELGTRQITLTTTWTARYRVDGTTQWRDVVGTAATSVTSAPFTVEERRSHLVAELCTAVPTPTDCPSS